MSIAEIERIADSGKAGKSGEFSRSLADAMASLASLDLMAVKLKVVDDKGWSEKIADYAELRYRRFLCMHLINPRLMLVPPPDIDAFWHQHILFTREYATECERLFGGFLHHSPASGEEGEAAAMQQGSMETAKFYADTFGEHYFAAEPEGLSSNWLEFFGEARSEPGPAGLLSCPLTGNPQ